MRWCFATVFDAETLCNEKVLLFWLFQLFFVYPATQIPELKRVLGPIYSLLRLKIPLIIEQLKPIYYDMCDIPSKFLCFAPFPTIFIFIHLLLSFYIYELKILTAGYLPLQLVHFLNVLKTETKQY